MTPSQAVDWLRQVQGELYRSQRPADGRDAWVVVVRTPAVGASKGKLIIALGDSMPEAAAAAEREWDRLWADLGCPN